MAEYRLVSCVYADKDCEQFVNSNLELDFNIGKISDDILVMLLARELYYNTELMQHFCVGIDRFMQAAGMTDKKLLMLPEGCDFCNLELIE